MRIRPRDDRDGEVGGGVGIPGAGRGRAAAAAAAVKAKPARQPGTRHSAAMCWTLLLPLQEEETQLSLWFRRMQDVWRSLCRNKTGVAYGRCQMDCAWALASSGNER